MNFDLSELRAFVALADTGSFGQAADALNLSQPAVSRRIEKLETALDTKLFERTTRKVELTPIGRSYLDSARHILNEVQSSLLFSRDRSQRLSGQIHIACVPSVVGQFLPEVIATYHRRFPRIRICIADETASKVVVAVMRGQADFGMTYMSADEPDLEFAPVFEEPFVVACPVGHPLAVKKQVKWADLADHPYMTIAQGSMNRTLIDLALAEAGITPDWYCEVRHVPALVSLVMSGLGVGVVPRLAMPVEGDPSVVSIPLVGPALSRTLGLVKRRGRPLSPAAQHFYDMLQASVSGSDVPTRLTTPIGNSQENGPVGTISTEAAANTGSSSVQA